MGAKIMKYRMRLLIPKGKWRLAALPPILIIGWKSSNVTNNS